MWCLDGPIGTTSYVAQYVVQSLLAGPAVVTALVCWVNALLAVRGAREEELWDEWKVWRVEAWVLGAPFSAVVKGPGVAGEMGVVKGVRGWWDKRKAAVRGMWLRKGGEVLVDASEGIFLELKDLEGSVTLELQPMGKDQGGGPVQEASGASLTSSAPPPSYTSDNPLS